MGARAQRPAVLGVGHARADRAARPSRPGRLPHDRHPPGRQRPVRRARADRRHRRDRARLLPRRPRLLRLGRRATGPGRARPRRGSLRDRRHVPVRAVGQRHPGLPLAPRPPRRRPPGRDQRAGRGCHDRAGGCRARPERLVRGRRGRHRQHGHAAARPVRARSHPAWRRRLRDAHDPPGAARHATPHQPRRAARRLFRGPRRARLLRAVPVAVRRAARGARRGDRPP